MAIICGNCGKWYMDNRAPDTCVACGCRLPPSASDLLKFKIDKKKKK